MPTKSDQVDVQGAATLVVPASDFFRPSGARSFTLGRYVTVKNIGPAVAFIGGIDVAPDSGVPINAGGAFNFTLGISDELWAATSGALATVSYVETGGPSQ